MDKGEGQGCLSSWRWAVPLCPDLRLRFLLVLGVPERPGYFQRWGPPSSLEGIPALGSLSVPLLAGLGGMCLHTQTGTRAAQGTRALTRVLSACLDVCCGGGSVGAEGHLESRGRVLGCLGLGDHFSSDTQGPALHLSPYPGEQRLQACWAPGEALTLSVQLLASEDGGSWHCSVGPSSFCRFPNCRGVSFASGERTHSVWGSQRLWGQCSGCCQGTPTHAQDPPVPPA